MSDLLREFQSLLASGDESGSSIDALLTLMPPTAATHLRLCAIPHEFNGRVLQAMAPELDGTEAKARYEEFSQLSCVVPVPDGLALHDSTRAELFARWLKPDHRPHFRDINARLVLYYERRGASELGTARETVIHAWMFHLLGADPARGFEEFESLCRNARRENRWAACSNLIRLVHEYDPVLTAEQTVWLRYHEAKLAIDIAQWDRAQALFRRILDDAAAPAELLVKTRLRLGYLATERGDLAEAVEDYQQALDLILKVRPRGIAHYDVLRSLGEAYRDRREYERAEKLMSNALAEAQAAGDPAGVADIYNSLGTLYLKRREVSEAATAYGKGLDILLRDGRRLHCAQMYNNLGNLYAEARDWQKAEEFYRKSLDIKEEAGDSVGQARTLLNLVQVYRNRMEMGAAIEANLRAVRFFEAMRHPLGLARAKRMLGRLYVASGAQDEARVALRDAVTLFERSHADADARDTREELAEIGRRIGLPWWAWVIIGAGCVLLLGIIALIVIAIMK